MIFAGLHDAIHTEFFEECYRDILVIDHKTGSKLFEWREARIASSHCSNPILELPGET